jgi:hypothetical protein
MTKIEDFQILQTLQEQKCYIDNLGKKNKTINRSKYNVSLKMENKNQSLVGSAVIGAELGREDHDSIPRNCDREKVGTT